MTKILDKIFNGLLLFILKILGAVIVGISTYAIIQMYGKILVKTITKM